MFAAAGIYETSWFSAKFSCHSGRSSLLFLAASTRQLLKFAGYNEVGDSSGSDVEEELVLELDDSPGTTRGTKSCIDFSSHLWTDVAFDRWPTPTFFSALRRVF